MLSGLVQCLQELVELILGLATEHRKQLLILIERRHLNFDGFHLLSTENHQSIKFTDKSGIFDIQLVHQERVILPDTSRVNESFIEI